MMKFKLIIIQLDHPIYQIPTLNAIKDLQLSHAIQIMIQLQLQVQAHTFQKIYQKHKLLQWDQDLQLYLLRHLVHQGQQHIMFLEN